MRSRSGSVTSRTSNKELSADNIEIFVNIADGKTIKLNVQPINTVSNVLEFLSASTTLPANVQLLHKDNPLDPSTTVGELNLEPSFATFQLSPSVSTAPSDKSGASTPRTGTGTSTPTRVGTPKKSNKPRCSKVGCKSIAQPIVGDCGFCSKRFCGKHRMLESHNCEGLEDARQADKQRNAAKLEGERTQMLRGL